MSRFLLIWVTISGVREAKFTCEEEVKDDKSEKILKICIAALAMATLAAVAAVRV